MNTYDRIYKVLVENGKKESTREPTPETVATNYLQGLAAAQKRKDAPIVRKHTKRTPPAAPGESPRLRDAQGNLLPGVRARSAK